MSSSHPSTINLETSASQSLPDFFDKADTLTFDKDDTGNECHIEEDGKLVGNSALLSDDGQVFPIEMRLPSK